MPNKPINIEFTSDTDKYEKGLKDAEKATKHLGDEIEDLPKSSDKAARGIKADMDDVEDTLGDAGKEAGAEFQANLGESIASGDLSSIVGDTIGGLATAVGPAMVPFLAAFGFAFATIKAQWEATTQAIQEQTDSMWSTILDTVTGKIGAAFAKVNEETLVATELHRLWQDEPKGMTELVNSAKELGINAWDVTRARAGDEDALARVKAALDDVYDTQNKTGTATTDQIKAVQNIEDAWYRAEEATAQTKAQVDAYNTSVLVSGQSVANLKADLEAMRNAPPITIEVKRKMVDQYGSTNVYGGNVGGTSSAWGTTSPYSNRTNGESG